MISFRISKLRIRIDFSFLVFTALIFLVKSGAEIFRFSFVCQLHELGHAAALCFCGGELSELMFCGTGIKMIPKRTSFLSLSSEAAVLLAGPAVNVIMWAVCRAVGADGKLAVLSLAAAAFNMLPYDFLDGGGLINLTSLPAVRMIAGSVKILIIALLLYGTLFVDIRLILLLCASIFNIFQDGELLYCDK